MIIKAIVNDISLLDKLYDLPFFPWKMIGKSQTGIDISGEGLALYSRGIDSLSNNPKIELSFSSNYLMFGSKENALNCVEFLFPNIIIGFDDFKNIENKSFHYINQSHFELTYKDKIYLIIFTGNDEVYSKSKEIKSRCIDTLTTKIIIQKKNEEIYFCEAEDIIRTISELISFVYGDSVNWINANGLTGDNAILIVFRDIDYCGLKLSRELIRFDFPCVLTSYIKQTFDNYNRFSEKKRKYLIMLSKGIQFSAERLNFPTPFISLSSFIEEFISNTMDDLEAHYITRSKRNGIKPEFENWILSNVAPLLSDVDKKDFNIEEKLAGLLQRSLRCRIIKLLEKYKINFEYDWVADFVKKRNSATHGTYAYEKNDYFSWTRMASLMEQVVLKELCFHGDYFDWSTSPPSTKEFK